MTRREFSDIIEDPSLSPPDKYAEVRATYPTFGEAWVSERIRLMHPSWGRYGRLEPLREQLEDAAEDPSTLDILVPLDSHDLHYIALRMGPPDFGMAAIYAAIATHPKCDRGTALMLYWSAVYAYKSPGTGWQCEEEGFDAICEELRDELRPVINDIEQRLRCQAYRDAEISFDPRVEYESVLDSRPVDFRAASPGEPFDQFAE